MDFGLSSGEDSDEDDTAPTWFEEEIKKSDGWVDLESTPNIPPLTLRNIHSYFIQKRLKREHITATKPFEKGYRMYAANKVKTISLKTVHSSIFTIIRATVLPSQRHNRIYEVNIASNTTNGTVLYATCTCIAGACGACNHTAALMFAIDDKNRQHGPSVSCTSLPAKWPVPSRASLTPQAVQDMQIVKPAYNKTPSLPTAHLPMPQELAKVTVERVRRLKEDLSNNYDGQLLLHQIWPDM